MTKKKQADEKQGKRTTVLRKQDKKFLNIREIRTVQPATEAVTLGSKMITIVKLTH